MTPFPNILEGASQFLPKEEKTAAENLKNEKLEALTDHIDYAEKLENFRGHISDIEQGLYDKEYEFIDMEMGVNFIGDHRTSLVAIRNDAPLLATLERELIALGYDVNKKEKNTSFSKIFPNRKSSPLF